MKKFILIILVLVFSLGAFLYAREFYNFNNPKSKEIEIRGKIFKIETAVSSKEKQKGLSERDILCKDCGMLFLFDKKENRPFWMKDMRFNLDIVWISGDKIVEIARNVSYENGEKEIINPEFFSDKVLEINAGICDELGINVGDSVNLK